eukprot:TRINITY_DN1734_c0_g1_i2.p1 TRINITY_DN1734_c0_g1~~TRINITY_DN1734_c0_g1_i2.p1  ORF type:complete len:253 (+),score=98.47 TRINITY_DN1734_c0_g1_i2:254-1012(+)
MESAPLNSSSSGDSSSAASNLFTCIKLRKMCGGGRKRRKAPSSCSSSCRPPASTQPQAPEPILHSPSTPPSVVPPRALPPSSDVQVDYKSHLVPRMQEILNCQFYWGKIDRYEAELLLEGKEEGTFLLRDSVQDEFVFSVSFRRYSRSLHARIEESEHRFTFDCHDPEIHSSESVTQLLEKYKNPSNCMFFEPMLVNPVLRKHVFSLKDLSRSVITDHSTYSSIGSLPLPKSLKRYLREYHYNHKVAKRYLH